MVLALKPSLEALAQDKENRHQTANVAQSAIELATANQGRVQRLEETVKALLGDGTGENGKLAIMGNNIRKTQDDVAEVKGDMKSVLQKMTELNTIGEQSKSWMSGARGFYLFLGVMALLVTIIGGVATALFWLYKH